ncbi:hypothetical protein DFR50_13735 [Roseiarcus fermentans]|uniref:Phospholipase D-like domain-containing protein n=1 Tax=Roseiarcus fermentans TaxID=1473586 RepID=A0A366ETN1_9HYPH|nr:hypothetical protein [Roseiarcus fermentans]RBP05050.1 hypothetical protein DFR50_13735 [Roseiarcus fermentans]
MPTLLVVWVGLLLLAARPAGAQTAILQNEPQNSPFAYILDALARHPGTPQCYIDEGYLNFLEDWDLDPDIVPTPGGGTSDIRRWRYPPGSEPGSPDVTRTFLSGLDAIRGADVNVAVSRKDCDGCANQRPYLREVLPKGRLHIDLPADATHAKTVQCSNGSVYMTQNGSTNLQTVGVTTKANSALVFVELGAPDRAPPLYARFRTLWRAVVEDTGTVFPGGTHDSSGLDGMTTPAEIGGRKVSFYAGRRHAFVGPTWSDGGLSRPFPDNLHPPAEGEVDDLQTVDWYDQVILDAATWLAEGRAVTVDVFMFEVGAANPFVDNLARLVRFGFVDCPVAACPSFASAKVVSVSKKPGAVPAPSAFPGKLTVNFYYQFQNGCARRAGCATTTSQYLNSPIAGGSSDYTMRVRKVWQGFADSRMEGNPERPFTPQDMHLKVVVVTAGRQAKLYISTSNLDTPDKGSGRKWQAGTVVDTAVDDELMRFFQRELHSIAEDGDLSQFRLGAANASGNSYFDRAVRPAEEPFAASGIAAFVFPLNVQAAEPHGPRQAQPPKPQGPAALRSPLDDGTTAPPVYPGLKKGAR